MVTLTKNGRGDAGIGTFFGSVLVGVIVFFASGGNAAVAAGVAIAIIGGGEKLGAEP
jgi:hypothetical protein